MMRHDIVRSMMVLVAASAMGCSQSFGPTDGAMERSRQITELKEQNAGLKLRIAELESKQESITSESAEPLNPASLPRPVVLQLARGSEVRSGKTPTATVRFETLDAHGRFVQVTGPAEVVLAVIDAEGDAHRLISMEYASDALQARLRGGFMGMAYSMQAPISKESAAWIPSAGGSVMVRLTVHDARLKSPLTVEKLISVLPSRAE